MVQHHHHHAHQPYPPTPLLVPIERAAVNGVVVAATKGRLVQKHSRQIMFAPRARLPATGLARLCRARSLPLAAAACQPHRRWLAAAPESNRPAQPAAALPHAAGTLPRPLSQRLLTHDRRSTIDCVNGILRQADRTAARATRRRKGHHCKEGAAAYLLQQASSPHSPRHALSASSTKAVCMRRGLWLGCPPPGCAYSCSRHRLYISLQGPDHPSLRLRLTLHRAGAVLPCRFGRGLTPTAAASRRRC